VLVLVTTFSACSNISEQSRLVFLTRLGQAPGLTANFRPCWKGFPGTNTLAYDVLTQ